MSHQVTTGELITATHWNEIERRYPSSATVATSQTRTNTAYGDMATVGPAVTRTTGTSALVVVSAIIFSSGAAGDNYMSYAVSGASTVAASDTTALENSSTLGLRASAVSLITGLTAGSNTFTSKYRAASGTVTCINRDIIVTPVGPTV